MSKKVVRISQVRVLRGGESSLFSKNAPQNEDFTRSGEEIGEPIQTMKHSSTRQRSKGTSFFGPMREKTGKNCLAGEVIGEASTEADAGQPEEKRLSWHKMHVQRTFSGRHPR